LRPDGTVDRRRTRALIASARPLAVTFHRAIDVARDPLAALDDLLALGVDRVLTSGQSRTALAGARVIASLVERAAGRVVILAGGGVDETNAREVVARTGVREIHVRGTAPARSAMRYKSRRVRMGGAPPRDEFTLPVTDARRIRRILQRVRW